MIEYTKDNFVFNQIIGRAILGLDSAKDLENALEQFEQNHPGIIGWEPWGNRMASSQSTTPYNALSEPLTNAYDAVFQTLLDQSNPSNSADGAGNLNSYEDVVNLLKLAPDPYYEYPSGSKISDLGKSYVYTILSNQSTITICDTSAGVEVSKFKSTFLRSFEDAVLGSNKRDIPWSHAKYSQGMKAPMAFLGKSEKGTGYMLIASVSQNQNSGQLEIAFTVTRLRKPSICSPSEFMTVSGQVPSMSYDPHKDYELIFNCDTKRDSETPPIWYHGSLVRLMDYQCNTNVLDGKTYHDNIRKNMFNLPVPTRIYSLQGQRTNNTPAWNTWGLWKDIFNSRNHKYIFGGPYTGEYTILVDGDSAGKITIKTCLFHFEENGEILQKPLERLKAGGDRFFIVINGQTHAKLPKRWLTLKSQQRLGLGRIRDHILCQIDVTGVSVDGLESAFIANRETMIEGDIKTQIEEHLREHLNQPYFKEYVAQYEKAVDALNHQNKNRGDLVDFKKWPDDMFNSINKGSRGVPMKWNPTTDTVIPKLALKSVPTIFKLANEKRGTPEKPFKWTQGWRKKFEFVVDAENDYFDKPNGGIIRVLKDDIPVRISSRTLIEGRLEITLPSDYAPDVNDTTELDFQIIDYFITGPYLDVSKVWVSTVPAPKTKSIRKKRKKVPRSAHVGDTSLDYVLVYRDDPHWINMDFSEYTGAMARDSSGGKTRYYLNMSNVGYQSYCKRIRQREANTVYEKLYINSLLAYAALVKGGIPNKPDDSIDTEIHDGQTDEERVESETKIFATRISDLLDLAENVKKTLYVGDE